MSTKTNAFRRFLSIAPVAAAALGLVLAGVPQSAVAMNHGQGGGHGPGPAAPAAVADVAVPHGALTLRAPWARASMGMARAGAAFLTVENAGGDDRLIAATAEISDRVELHTHLMEDGVMRMREVEGGIEIPAGETVTLAPGGLHVMFLGLVAPLEEGATFPVTLTFAEAGDVTVDIQVLAPGAGGMHNRGN